MTFFEVFDQFAGFDVGEDEGLTTAGEARHLVDADGHGLDGDATEAEVYKDEEGECGVHGEESAAGHEGEGEFGGGLCETEEEDDDRGYEGHVD